MKHFPKRSSGGLGLHPLALHDSASVTPCMPSKRNRTTNNDVPTQRYILRVMCGVPVSYRFAGARRGATGSFWLGDRCVVDLSMIASRGDFQFFFQLQDKLSAVRRESIRRPRSIEHGVPSTDATYLLQWLHRSGSKTYSATPHLPCHTQLGVFPVASYFQVRSSS